MRGSEWLKGHATIHLIDATRIPLIFPPVGYFAGGGRITFLCIHARDIIRYDTYTWDWRLSSVLAYSEFSLLILSILKGKYAYGEKGKTCWKLRVSEGLFEFWVIMRDLKYVDNGLTSTKMYDELHFIPASHTYTHLNL